MAVGRINARSDNRGFQVTRKVKETTELSICFGHVKEFDIMGWCRGWDKSVRNKILRVTLKCRASIPSGGGGIAVSDSSLLYCKNLVTAEGPSATKGEEIQFRTDIVFNVPRTT